MGEVLGKAWKKFSKKYHLEQVCPGAAFHVFYESFICNYEKETRPPLEVVFGYSLRGSKPQVSKNKANIETHSFSFDFPENMQDILKIFLKKFKVKMEKKLKSAVASENSQNESAEMNVSGCFEHEDPRIDFESSEGECST